MGNRGSVGTFPSPRVWLAVRLIPAGLVAAAESSPGFLAPVHSVPNLVLPGCVQIAWQGAFWRWGVGGGVRNRHRKNPKFVPSLGSLPAEKAPLHSSAPGGRSDKAAWPRGGRMHLRASSRKRELLAELRCVRALPLLLEKTGLGWVPGSDRKLGL